MKKQVNAFPFTEARIRSLQPTDRDQWFSDDHKAAVSGFKCRVSPEGSKRFVLIVRIDGNSRKLTLGKFPDLSVIEARNLAKIRAAEVLQGIDPRQVKADRKAKAELTLRIAIENYLTHRKIKTSTRDDVRQRLINSKVSGLAGWLDKPLISITRKMVAGWYTKRAEQSASGALLETRYLKAVLNSVNALEPSTLEDNPFEVIAANKMGGKLKSRKTYVAENDMPAFMAALEGLESTRGQFDIARDFLRFLLFSGCRLNEAATLQVEHIDLESRTFTLLDTKNGEDVVLPLNTVLYEIAQRRLIETSGKGYLFPSTGGDQFGRPKKALKAVIKASKVQFTPHDLRRTFRSAAESCGLGMKLGMTLINHKLSGSLAVDLDYIQVTPDALLKASEKVANELQRQAGALNADVIELSVVRS